MTLTHLLTGMNKSLFHPPILQEAIGIGLASLCTSHDCRDAFHLVPGSKDARPLTMKFIVGVGTSQQLGQPLFSASNP